MQNVFFCCIMLCCMVQVKASIVIPPQNLGDLEQSAEIVVYGTITGHLLEKAHLNSFQIIQSLKGNLSTGDAIVVEEYAKKIGDMIQDLLGDTNYKIGKNYLLFLSKMDNGYYKSSLMALSVFEEVVLDGKRVFAHEAAFQELCIVGVEEVDFDGLRAVYELEPMLHALDRTINYNIPWDNITAGITAHYSEWEMPNHMPKDEIESEDEKGACPNPAPSHCTTMVGSPNGTGSNAPAKFVTNAWTVRVPVSADDDPSNSNNIVNLQSAITNLNAIPGITISYGGIDASATTINCADPNGTILGWAGVATNTAYVLFDDPCNNIPNIAPGCGAGILAVGGGFTSTVETHTDACGKVWKNRFYPYLLMNNGIGCKGEYDYTAVIMHELIHGLGLGHISGSCTSLMNAFLCASNNSSNAPNYGITSLDEQCIEWMYNAGGTPPPTSISVSPKLYLQGALSGSSMHTDLVDNEILPTQEPYGIDNKLITRTLVGIVDWVVVEIRDGQDNTNILARQTALLKPDGRVVDTNGFSPLSFALSPGNYFVAVRHRNHLGIMTATAIALD